MSKGGGGGGGGGGEGRCRNLGVKRWEVYRRWEKKLRAGRGIPKVAEPGEIGILQ